MPKIVVLVLGHLGTALLKVLYTVMVHELVANQPKPLTNLYRCDSTCLQRLVSGIVSRNLGRSDYVSQSAYHNYPLWLLQGWYVELHLSNMDISAHTHHQGKIAGSKRFVDQAFTMDSVSSCLLLLASSTFCRGAVG